MEFHRRRVSCLVKSKFHNGCLMGGLQVSYLRACFFLGGVNVMPLKVHLHTSILFMVGGLCFIFFSFIFEG